MSNTFAERKKIGYAAEFRVISELLLRGENPMRSYVDVDGIDLILRNGKTVQVKTSKAPKGNKSKNGECFGYYVALTGSTVSYNKGEYTKKCHPKFVYGGVDFIIIWCRKHDDFYIIPAIELLGKKAIYLPYPRIKKKSESKYEKYKNAWHNIISEHAVNKD